MAKLPLRTQLFINNEYVDAVSKQTFASINPRTEQEIVQVQQAGPEDVDKAVAAASEAFKTWKLSDGSLRRTLLLKLADLMEQHKERLAEVEGMDNGKPCAVARDVDIGLCIECYRYYAGFADKGMCGKTIPLTQNTSSMLCYTLHEPVGVVGQIIPWNFPLLMQAWKLGPALACGCTVVMKLSEKTPLSGLMLGQLIKEAGFPKGVVNILNGAGPVTGAAIAKHPGIAKVAFTGSVATGQRIAEMAAATNLKRVTLELGGKSPLIVCRDADLDQAALQSHIGLWLNMGQCCVASSRIFVHEDVEETFAAKCVELAKKLKRPHAWQGAAPTGNGYPDPKRARYDKVPEVPILEMGPQVDKIQFDKILGFIETGKKEGAKCVLGGKRAGDKGYFIEPTVFTGVTDQMTIAKEEIFGPVMQILTFKDLDEVVERANKTEFGLGAGVMTRDVGTALKLSQRLEAGTVWVNCYDNFDLAAPFGGYKMSGQGREKGEYALQNYTEVKCVMIPMDARA